MIDLKSLLDIEPRDDQKIDMDRMNLLYEMRDQFQEMLGEGSRASFISTRNDARGLALTLRLEKANVQLDAVSVLATVGDKPWICSGVENEMITCSSRDELETALEKVVSSPYTIQVLSRMMEFGKHV